MKDIRLTANHELVKTMHKTKLSKTDSSIYSNSLSPNSHSQLAYRPFASQPAKVSSAAKTSTDIENVAFAEQQMEATGLEIQAKYGKITPEGQERLTVLQAKMDGLLNSRLSHATQFGHNIANIPLLRPQTSTPIQAKLTIGEPGDKYEQEADETARQVVQRIHQSQGEKVQRESLLEEEELQMKPERRIQTESLPLSDNSNTIQRKADGSEKHDAELTEIINSLKALQSEEDVQSDPETFKEIAHYIEKATEVLKGDDAQAKEVLIESTKTGTSSTVDAEQVKDADSSVQMKAAGSASVHRVVGIVLGIHAAVAIGYGIYRIRRNRRRVATPAPDAGEILNIPTTRAEYGKTSAYGGLTNRERTNEEIQEEVRNRTAYNHNVLYQQLIKDDNVTDIAKLIHGIRDDNGLCIGTLCHDLTRFLIQKRTQVRPTIEQLKELTGATVIQYDLNSNNSLENLLRGSAPGTSVYLGSDQAMSGHTFTVVGENRGRVIVADRQPANPIAALKYASAVEAEAKLSRNLNPDQQDAIDREFSGRLVLNQFEAQ